MKCSSKLNWFDWDRCLRWIDTFKDWYTSWRMSSLCKSFVRNMKKTRKGFELRFIYGNCRDFASFWGLHFEMRSISVKVLLNSGGRGRTCGCSEVLICALNLCIGIGFIFENFRNFWSKKAFEIAKKTSLNSKLFGCLKNWCEIWKNWFKNGYLF